MYDRNLSIEDADKEQNDLDNKLIGINRGKIPVKKVISKQHKTIF